MSSPQDTASKSEKKSPRSDIGSSSAAEKESASGRIIEVVVVESSIVKVDISPSGAPLPNSSLAKLRQSGSVRLDDHSAGSVIGGDCKDRAIIRINDRGIQDPRVGCTGLSYVPKIDSSRCVRIDGP